MKKYIKFIPVIIIILIQACGGDSTSSNSQKLTGSINFLDQEGNNSALQVSGTVELYLGVEDRVEYYDPNYPFVGPDFDEYWNTDHRTLNEPYHLVETDINGNFEIDNVESGKYICVYSAPGFGWHKRILEIDSDYAVTLYMRESIVNPLIIDADISWGPDQHIIINDDLAIMNNNKLTILENTIIEFEDASLIVIGELEAIGTITEPIIFTSASELPGKSDWDKIYIAANTGELSMQYSIIQWPYLGFDCANPISLSNTAIINVGFDGLNILECSSQIDNCLIFDCENGIYLTSSNVSTDQPEIHQTIISNNSGNGVEAFESSPEILNSVFRNNSYHVFGRYSAHINIEHCAFFDSEDAAIRSYREEEYDDDFTIYKCIIDDDENLIHCARSAPMLATNNNLISENGYVFELYYSLGTNIQVTATNNWWGTTNEFEIQELIWDENDQPGDSYDAGVVEYNPWSNSEIEDAGPQP